MCGASNEIRKLLEGDDGPHLYVSGTVSNQGRFYERFDAVVLLSAPANVLLTRIETRSTNAYGKTAAQRELLLRDLADAEPRLRRTCTHEIDATQPVTDVVTQLTERVRTRSTGAHRCEPIRLRRSPRPRRLPHPTARSRLRTTVADRRGMDRDTARRQSHTPGTQRPRSMVRRNHTRGRHPPPAVPRTELVERARATLAPILVPKIHWTELKRFDDEPAQPPVVLPQSIVALVQPLPHSAEDEPRHVALVMRDGRILENVELSPSGAIVISINDDARFTLEPGQVADVLERAR